MTAPSAIWAWFAGVDPRIWQAVLAGLFVATGWIYNGWQNRREAQSLRAERLRDVHRALYAEIGATLANLGSEEAIAKGGARISGLIRDNPGYHPFIARLDRGVIFKAIVGDIHILPRTSIDAVVAFYGQLAAIDALTDDLRSETLKALSTERRIAIYEDYTALRLQAFLFGNLALSLIDAYAKGGKEAARAAQARLSNLPSADRSDL